MKTAAIAALLAVLASSAAGEKSPADRVVAVVDKKVITQGDWDLQEHFEALAEGRPPEVIRFQRRSLNRLILRSLVKQQMTESGFTPVGDAEVKKTLAILREAAVGQGSDADWKSALARYHLTEDEVETQAREGLNVLRFIDQRFRPSAIATQDDIEKYYQDELLPALAAQSGSQAKAPPLEQVRDKIAAIIVERKVDALVEDWLTGLRRQSEVRILADEYVSKETPKD